MSNTYDQQFQKIFIDEIKKRLFEENIPRLKKCLAQLTEEEIWYRPNEHSNTVGNLVLHLCGNVRQWLIAGLSPVEDVRERQKEFDENGPLPTDLLLAKVDEMERDATKVLNTLSPADLLENRVVQGIYHETGISVLVHVTEHFSYHVGQITYIVKQAKNMDMGYYEGLNLDGK